MRDPYSSSYFTTRLIESAIFWLQMHRHQSPAMLICPVYGCKIVGDDLMRDFDLSADDINNALAAVDRFEHSPAADGSLGTLRLNADYTVGDALKAIDFACGFFYAGEDEAVLESTVDSQIVGVTEYIDVRGQRLIVNKATFAQKTGLPLTSERSDEFTVFLHTVPELARPENRKSRSVLLFIRGKQPGEMALPEATALDHCWSRLQSRAQSEFDVRLTPLQVPGIADGWQLRAHPQFGMLLGILRAADSQLVWREEGILRIDF